MQDRKIFFNLHPQKKEKIRASYVRPSGHCVLNGYLFQGKSKKLSQVVKRRKGVKGVTHLRSLSLSLCVSVWTLSKSDWITKKRCFLKEMIWKGANLMEQVYYTEPPRSQSHATVAQGERIRPRLKHTEIFKKKIGQRAVWITFCLDTGRPCKQIMSDVLTVTSTKSISKDSNTWGGYGKIVKRQHGGMRLAKKKGSS